MAGGEEEVGRPGARQQGQMMFESNPAMNWILAGGPFKPSFGLSEAVRSPNFIVLWRHPEGPRLYQRAERLS